MHLVEKSLRKVLLTKLKLIVDARQRWPKFASLTEDELLRSEKWNDIISSTQKRVRIIMHDMTNIPLPQPADADMNSATWNTYYNMCCAKGGVFTQLCGWEGTLELYIDATGDSDYIRKTKILEEQRDFMDADKQIDGSIVPFINVFDKGYRVLLDCFSQGRQLCWQPAFARSDQRYRSHDVLHTATVAYTRSGNERSVRHMKRSGLIKRGLTESNSMDLNTLADLWLAWGFQVNFMYSPVH